MAELDDLLVQLTGSINTDLMPGANDPATAVLPQQPLHRCMFPQAGRYPTLQSVTNPYSCTLGGRRLLATAGQAVRDVLRNTDMTDPLDAMESCLRWGHVAPTCPDTLGCYPYTDQDPFVLDHLPGQVVVLRRCFWAGWLRARVRVCACVTGFASCQNCATWVLLRAGRLCVGFFCVVGLC